MMIKPGLFRALKVAFLPVSSHCDQRGVLKLVVLSNSFS
jgi:hypothetical protein